MKYAKDIPSSAQMLEIAREGAYTVNGRIFPLPRTHDQLRQARYCSPAEAERLAGPEFLPGSGKPGPGRMGLAALDSLRAARALHEKYPDSEKGVLVLNFAHPHRPGGSFRENPGTQEEQLCHYTTLVASLETPSAAPFYESNRAAKNPAQTHAMVLSPHVMVLRDKLENLTEKPFPISVLTVSAPMANKMEPEALPELPGLILTRVRAMVRFAIAKGYRHLVLGAWGCGNFGNDPALVAASFHRALTEPFADGTTAGDHLEEVVFGIPSGAAPNPRRQAFAQVFPEIPL